jgi:hypothetical protein
MAENVDRHRNFVMNLENTFSQRLGNKWQIFCPHEDTRVTWWLGDNPFKPPTDSQQIHQRLRLKGKERLDCFPKLNLTSDKFVTVRNNRKK